MKSKQQLQSSWKSYKVYELGKVVTGKTPPTKNTEYFGDFIQFLTPSDNLDRKFVKTTKRKLSKQGLDLLERICLPPGSISVSCIGSDMGKSVFIKKPTITNQQFNSLIPNDIDDSNFLYYYFFYIKKELKNLAGSGTALPILKKSLFSDIDIMMPPKPIRTKIGHILNSIDEQISFFESQNTILEQIIQSLFKSYFIDFDGQTKFMDSELGQIPKGWFVSNLSNVCEKITDGSHYSPKEDLNGTKKIATVKNMQEYNFDFDVCKKISDHDFEQLVKNGCSPQTGDVLLSKDGTMGLSMFFYNFQPVVLLSSIAILKPKVGLNFYLKTFLSRNEIVDELIGGHASGSALPRIVLKDLKEFKITVPDEQTLKKFNKLAEPILKQLFKNSCFIYNLSKLRDSLLPKLMSGELVN